MMTAASNRRCPEARRRTSPRTVRVRTAVALGETLGSCISVILRAGRGPIDSTSRPRPARTSDRRALRPPGAPAGASRNAGQRRKRGACGHDRTDRRHGAVWGAAAGLAVLVFVSTLLLGWQIADEPNPAANRIFASATLQDDTPRADIAGTVSDVDGEIISVRVGEDLVRVRVGAGAVIQRLTPITPDSVAPGD